MSCAIAGGGDGGLLVDHCHHANPSRVAFQVVAIDFVVLDVSQVSLGHSGEYGNKCHLGT